MRQFFRRRPEGAATGPAAEHNPLERSVTTALPSTKTFPSGIKLLHSAAQSTVDIVFVHGLTGDREKTWTASGWSEPWPKTLLPSELPTARVLTFGYDAYVTDWKGMVSQSRIANHAWKLLTSLAAYREKDDTNERPIIFVCHSLGGLVCEDALFTSRQRTEPHLHNILQSTRGIAFLGTPHHGSGLARWAELLSRSIGIIKQTNTQIVEVLKRDSEVLARIQDGFHTMVLARGKEGQRIEISCFFEELPLPGIGQVVPQDSAILPGYIPIGIHSNHMDMTKFASVDDPGFLAVCGELRRWTKQLGKAVTPVGNLLPPGYSSPSKDGRHGPDGSDGLDGLYSDATTCR
ncbi:sesB-related regulatory [Staphylotrichum tortipilum]|uniref:SesB-related regulatory n=1 Tax=Staphylotrichum tortipilum TaxID=2831512 RepID=A0AAN6MAJ1_9PEZI|nr:sesB-related regulatory [Staphylotrichum longicolle]